MLVNKKQNWEMYQETAATPASKPASRPNTKINLQLRKKCFALISMIAVLAMLVTLQSASIVKAGYELVQIKAQMAMLERENDQVRLEVARLKSPQRIQTIATKELGMTTPKAVYHAAAPVSQSANSMTTEPKAAKRSSNVFVMNKAEANGRR